MKQIAITAIALLLTGCQNQSWTQWSVPVGQEAGLLASVKAVAEVNGLEDRTGASRVNGTLAYYAIGGMSFTDVCVRKGRGNRTLVDLRFRIAGAGGGRKYRAIQQKLRVVLAGLYESDTVLERDHRTAERPEFMEPTLPNNGIGQLPSTAMPPMDGHS